MALICSHFGMQVEERVKCLKLAGEMKAERMEKLESDPMEYQ